MLLSRQDMIGILRAGGSVIFNGNHITELSQLPSAADIAIASGSKEVKEDTVIDLEKQLADVQKQLSELKEIEATKEVAKVKAPAKSTEI